MITAKIDRNDEGKICLVIEGLEELHAYLDLVKAKRLGNTYAEHPWAGARSVDAYNHTLSPGALLGEHRVVLLLSDYYRAPIPKTTLESLARSVSTAVSAVVEHYRPVVINVRVGLKLPDKAPPPEPLDPF
jgi:hypothetical protein